MKKILSYVIASILLIISLCAFECASTELTSAKLYIQQNNYEKALESLQKEVQKNPKSDEGYYLMGVVYRDQRKFVDMNNAFDKSLAISPKYKTEIEKDKNYAWITSYNTGVNLFNKADRVSKDSTQIVFDQAAENFKNAIQIRPDSAAVYKTLAVTYVRGNRLDDAVKTLEDQMNIKKTKDGMALLGELEINIGSNYKIKKDTVKATEYFNKAIDVLSSANKLYPEDADILNYLAQAYIDAGKASIAMETFKALSEKDPENATNLYNYGVLLLDANQYEKAIDEFKKAVAIKPDYSSAIYNIAVAYVKWGAELNKEADKTNTINTEAAKAAKDKFNTALPYLKQLLEMNPKDARVWDTIAKVYAVLGMQKDSEDAFKNADKYR